MFSSKVELDKTAEEFRKTHKERQELIKQWEYIIEQMQKRDNDIDEAAQVIEKKKLISREQKKYFNVSIRN